MYRDMLMPNVTFIFRKNPKSSKLTTGYPEDLKEEEGRAKPEL